MALQADHNHTFVGHIHVFDVAAVLLEIGADLFKCVLHFAFDGCFLFVGHIADCLLFF